MRLGVFDSGVGGITVLRELRKVLPGADYVYLGDTARMPYGAKSPAQVELLSSECTETLIRAGVEAVVVACNTASSLAMPAITKAAGAVPVFGVVEPGVEAVLEVSTGGPILVLATRATVNSGAYGRALRARLGPGTQVIEQACPLLAPMIEEGWIDHPVLHLTIAEYVAAHRVGAAGAALLACTHYPWIQAAVARALPGWRIVDSAEAVARAVRARLGPGPSAEQQGTVEWRFTDPQAVPAFIRQKDLVLFG